MTRREAIATFGAAAAVSAATAPEIDPAVVRANDESAGRYIEQQNTDSGSRWFGGIPDATGLFNAGSASGLVDAVTASFVHPKSKYYHDAAALARIQMAAKFLERSQSPDGNISLLTTNFNSPPDTGFVVWNVAEAASVARRHGAKEIEQALTPFLQRAAQGMAKGGVHTPNHRWVVSSALSQIYALWPEEKLLRRIDQWLAEGIDIDEDGQFTERSTTIYNGVSDRALTTLALKLKRPALFDPVRKNLDAMLYLLHADGEVVTEISTRQDLNDRGTMDRYWFPLRTLAVLDGNGKYAALVREAEPRMASLPMLLDHPEIAGALPANAALPEDFERAFKVEGLVRFRRGPVSASVLLDGKSRFFTLRRGGAVIEAVRFASAFFGKGQFKASEWSKEGSTYVLRQKLEAGYYQPLDPPERVKAGEWGSVRSKRKRTEICTLEQSASITETPKGFRVRVQSSGTDGVPLTIEIGLREGTRIEGAEVLSDSEFLASKGVVTCTRGGDSIRIGPGLGEHRYVHVRGAEAPLPGSRLYLTGLTPLDHTLEFEVT
jgi:hypothetical protein